MSFKGDFEAKQCFGCIDVENNHLELGSTEVEEMKYPYRCCSICKTLLLMAANTAVSLEDANKMVGG